MSAIYTAVEIGTTKTVLAIGEVSDGGRINISSYASIKSSGVRKSQITDIHNATQSIRSVINENEKNQLAKGFSVTIGEAFLVISGQHIAATPFQGAVQIENSKVTAEDIDEVAKAAREYVLPRDRDILEIIDQTYEIDSMGGIHAPKGMSGNILKLNTLQIHANSNRIKDAKTALENSHIELKEPLFAATCAANAVLTESDRSNGVLVLDLGGGSTGFAVYYERILAHAGVIGVGGDHITNDIANAFATTQEQAENLKILEANALIGTTNAEPRVKIPGSTPLMESRTVSRRALDTIVNARLRELFIIIREELEKTDLLHRLHAGVVITGGGAAMRGLQSLLQRELGMPVRVGTPLYVDGLSDLRNPETFASVAGALQYAREHFPEEKSIFHSLFGGFLK